MIVADRCQAQYLDARSLLPQTYIVFCLRHLGKDLERYIRRESDVIVGFYDIQKNLHTCNEYLQLLQNFLTDSEARLSRRDIVEWMIENSENCLPINLTLQGVFENWITNRAECFLVCSSSVLVSDDSA